MCVAMLRVKGSKFSNVLKNVKSTGEYLYKGRINYFLVKCHIHLGNKKKSPDILGVYYLCNYTLYEH